MKNVYKKPKDKGGRRYRFNTTFMREVVYAVLTENLSYSEAIKKFNIDGTGSMIQGWVKKFGTQLQTVEIETNTSTENTLKSDNKIKELEKALEQANLKIMVLETMIDVAEDELNIHIRKKPGSKQ